MANETRQFGRALSISPISRFAAFLDSAPTSEFTRSDLHRLILEKVDTSVPDSVIEAIFDVCDVDHNGLVSVQELYNFIDATKEERSMSDKVAAVSYKVACSTTFWSFVFFATASCVGIATNVHWRLRPGEEPNFNYDFMISMLFVFGTYAFVGQVVDATNQEQRLVERAKDKILLFVKNDHCTINSDEEMGPRDFYSILERDGLHIPAQTFMAVFADIDKDRNGTLSFLEIKAYALAREKRGQLSSVSFSLIVMKNCVLKLDYWLMWGWTVASLMSLVASSNNAWSDKAVLHIYGASYLLFSLCALTQHRLHYNEVKKTLAQMSEIKRMLLGQAISVSFGAADGEVSVVLRESAINTPSDAGSQNARTACRALFEKADVNGVPDGRLDFLELYNALMQSGFVFDVCILRSMFDEVDTDHDGQIDMNEFVEFVLNHDGKMTDNQKRWKAFTTMIVQTDFWVANIAVFGGVSLLPGNYSSSERSSMNWFFASSVSWFILSVYEAFRIVSLAAGNYDALAYGKVNFKRVVLRAILNSAGRQTNSVADWLDVPAEFVTCRTVSVAVGDYNGLVESKAM